MDLQSTLLQRLDSDPKARTAGWDVLVLAALEGASALDAQIDSAAVPHADGKREARPATAAYLTAITAKFALEGEGCPCTISMRWDADAGLDSGAATVQVQGKPKSTHDALGWRDPLATYRPFLATTSWAQCLTRAHRSSTTRS